MSILKKVAQLKSQITKIPKEQENPYYKSKYFDINQLLEYLQPKLEQHGLVLTQPIEGGCVKSVLHDTEGEETLSSSLPLPDMSDPQKMGSAITYYRRYTLQSLLALQAEDDDGNKASGVNGQKEKQPDTTTKGYPDDDRPWLDQKTKDAMLKAIQEGKGADVKERMNKYRMKKDYRNEINNELKAQNL